MQNRAPAAAYLGYVFEDTGYGAAARGYVHALHGAGVDVSVANLGFPQPPHFADSIITGNLNRSVKPDFYLWHSEPQDMLRLGGPFSQVIAVTTWEADLLPDDQVAVLNRMAEVWVPSRFNLETFRAQLKTPVFQLPHPVAQPITPRFDRAGLNQELGFRESDFVFVSVGSWQERKNLHGAVEAFLRAFPEDDDAILVLKTGFHFSPEGAVRAEIFHAINRANPRDRDAAAARIRLFPIPWPAECLASLAERADCFVSLHRGEGWGYPLFDAVCQGTPVVATGYSGPMDYLDPKVHRLVDYRLVAPDTRLASVAQFPFHRGMRWAEPDIRHASLLMREVYENRKEAREQAQAYAEVVREKYSVEAVGTRAAARLAALAESRQAIHSTAAETEASSSMPLPPPAGAMLTTPCRV